MAKSNLVRTACIATIVLGLAVAVLPTTEAVCVGNAPPGAGDGLCFDVGVPPFDPNTYACVSTTGDCIPT